MTVTVNTVSHEGFRHSIKIDDYEVFTDLPKTMGGESSAPSPHDYFDAALGACKALTLKLYAQRKEIPLTGVTVEVKHVTARTEQSALLTHTGHPPVPRLARRLTVPAHPGTDPALLSTGSIEPCCQ